MTKKKYFFHTTEKRNISRIKSKGLLPVKKGEVYCWRSLKSARILLSTPAYKGGAIIKVKPRNLSKIKKAGKQAVVHKGKITKSRIVKIIR